MASITVFKLHHHAGKACLEALSSNTEEAPGSDQTHTATAGTEAVFPVQAAVLVNDQLIMAGLYPDKVLLLKRDAAQEMVTLDAREQQFATEQSGTFNVTSGG